MVLLIWYFTYRFIGILDKEKDIQQLRRQDALFTRKLSSMFQYSIANGFCQFFKGESVGVQW